MSVILSALPEHERPRERLVAMGAEALSERELLALVLRSGRVGESALDVAGVLLARFRGLDGIARALPEELAEVAGVGPAKAAALVAAFRLSSLLDRPPASLVLDRSETIAQVAFEHLGRLRRERVIVLVCDGANRLIRVIPVSEGSVDRSLIPVREVLNAVLRNDGRGFALAHNHPAGTADPSEADRRATEALRAAAVAVGLRFLDHVLIAGGGWVSVKGCR